MLSCRAILCTRLRHLGIPSGYIPDLNLSEYIPDLNLSGNIPDLNLSGYIPDLNLSRYIPDLNLKEGSILENASCHIPQPPASARDFKLRHYLTLGWLDNRHSLVLYFNM